MVPAYLTAGVVTEGVDCESDLANLLSYSGLADDEDSQDTEGVADDGWRPLSSSSRSGSSPNLSRRNPTLMHNANEIRDLRSKRHTLRRQKREHFIYWSCLLCVLIFERTLRGQSVSSRGHYAIPEVIFSFPTFKLAMAFLFLHPFTGFASKLLTRLEEMDFAEMGLRHGDYVLGTHPVLVDLVKSVRKRNPKAMVRQKFASIVAEVRKQRAESEASTTPTPSSPRQHRAPQPPYDLAKERHTQHHAFDQIRVLEESFKQERTGFAERCRRLEGEAETAKAKLVKMEAKLRAAEEVNVRQASRGVDLEKERDRFFAELVESRAGYRGVVKAKAAGEERLIEVEEALADVVAREEDLREEVRQLRLYLGSQSLKAIGRERAVLAGFDAEVDRVHPYGVKRAASPARFSKCGTPRSCTPQRS